MLFCTQSTVTRMANSVFSQNRKNDNINDLNNLPDQTNGGLVLLSRSNAQTTPVYTTKVKPFVPILPHPANHITKQEILPVTTVPGSCKN